MILIKSPPVTIISRGMFRLRSGYYPALHSKACMVLIISLLKTNLFTIRFMEMVYNRQEHRMTVLHLMMWLSTTRPPGKIILHIIRNLASIIHYRRHWEQSNSGPLQTGGLQKDLV